MSQFRSIVKLTNLFVSTYFVLLLVGTVLLFVLLHISSQINASIDEQTSSTSKLGLLVDTPENKNKLSFLLDDFSPTPFPTAKPTPQSTPFPPKNWTCIDVPILMYHHVEPLEEAKVAGHAQLTVDSEVFVQQLKYLKDKGYTVITLSELAAFFDQGKTLPSKPIILTFDDGYADFHTYALPALVSQGMKGNLFIPTGLMENPGYLSWQQIKEIEVKGISIDHHTWSHANVTQTGDDFYKRELDLATAQLIEHGYGPVQIFAYPYGTHDNRSIEEMRKRGFTIAVTTLPGRIQCKEYRLALKRIRVGNSQLSAYGL